MSSFTTFKWEISDKKYLSFVNAKHQQEFSSSFFEVDNIKFYLKCYPNGRKKPGLVNIYLTLSEQHFPSNIAKLKINYWIFCDQTYSRMSDIRDFSSDDNNYFHGWSTNTLNLKELENNSVHNIDFTVGVNILKIYFKNEVAKGSSDINDMKQPLIYEKPFKMLPKNTFTWNINEFMFKSFLSAPNKKCWESSQFGQWVLGCYPNGHTKTDRGNAMLYLKCLGLPPGIYGVKIRYTLFCPQINLKWSYIQNYNYANTNYANATFKTISLHSLKSLSFIITISILKLYDLNRKEVLYKDIHKYLIKQNVNDMDEDIDTKAMEIEAEDRSVLIPIPNFNIFPTIQDIKDKISNIGGGGSGSGGNNEYDISSVQQQVDIYSKELQAMNREIYSTRKQCNDLQEKQAKNNTSFQTVLKQVKIIKDDINSIKNDGGNNDEQVHVVAIDKFKNQVSNLENEVIDLRQEVVSVKNEYNLLNLNNNKLMDEIINLKNEMLEMKKENEEINKIKGGFSLNNVSVAVPNDENKTNDDIESEKDKEKMQEMKEWVFTKLEFNKNVLNSIWQKLVNDGFDDISLLSELNDETLKNMGIHRVGDRIKILRACKTISHS